jgi:hypothetical protein
LEEASETVAAICNLCRGNNLPVIQRTLFGHEHKKMETSFFVGSVEDISLSWKHVMCSAIEHSYVQYFNNVFFFFLLLLLLLYYFNNIGLNKDHADFTWRSSISRS